MTVPIVDVHVDSYYKVGLARPILQSVRWRILPGEHWAVVGANGSGKSSLLAIVSGEIWPSRGTLHVLGAEYGRVDKRQLKKRIGMVSATLYASFPRGDTALEVAASGLDAMVGGLGTLSQTARDRGLRALERVGAHGYAKKPYGVLSQGERQRVMIARALINDPALLILDEPCGGLDPVARERFLADLQQLADAPDGPTQIHVTHHLEEIPPFVTHALLLKEGEVVASGPLQITMTDANLYRTFDVHCRVHRNDAGRLRLEIVD